MDPAAARLGLTRTVLPLCSVCRWGVILYNLGEWGGMCLFCWGLLWEGGSGGQRREAREWGWVPCFGEQGDSVSHADCPPLGLRSALLSIRVTSAPGMAVRCLSLLHGTSLALLLSRLLRGFSFALRCFCRGSEAPSRGPSYAVRLCVAHIGAGWMWLCVCLPLSTHYHFKTPDLLSLACCPCCSRIHWPPMHAVALFSNSGSYLLFSFVSAETCVHCWLSHWPPPPGCVRAGGSQCLSGT